jgi:CRISPR-associated protein Cas2
MVKKRKNKYAGVLRPTQVGAGSPTVSVLVMYDVENDRIRTRLANACLDYGLERVQFSAFLGKINRNRRQELALRIQAEVGDERARVRVIPITEDAIKEMWTLDQYAERDEPKVTAMPTLRVYSAGSDS